MIPFPTVESQRGLIGIETIRSKLDIRRPQPNIDSHTTPSVIIANNGPGHLMIDQSQTDDALTGGRPEVFWQRIYSQYRQVALDNLQYIVDKGNRLGDLTNRGNPIPDMALNEFIEGAPDLQVFGQASVDNIAFRYTPNALNIQVERGRIDVDVQINRPEVNVQHGSVNIYMQQYPKLTIIPPAINFLA